MFNKIILSLIVLCLSFTDQPRPNYKFTKPLTGLTMNTQHPLNKGLVGYWIFNEKAGINVYDITQNKINGTANNFALTGNTSNWVGSPMGGGLHFDGSDDFVNIGTLIHQYVDYDRPFSTSFWFTLTTYASSYYGLMGNVSQTGTAYDDVEFRVDFAGDRFDFVFQSAASINVQDGYRWATGDKNIAINKLYNLVYTYDGLNTTTSTKIYLNGQEEVVSLLTNLGTITRSVYSVAPTQPTYIGARNWSGNDFRFPGLIDEVRIYNRVLNAMEVQTLYTNPHIDILNNKLY